MLFWKLLDDKSYREAEMNVDNDGHYINSDKKLRKAFRSDEFNILVVANKYQTGFDEPLLHSMYVTKNYMVLMQSKHFLD